MSGNITMPESDQHVLFYHRTVCSKQYL